MVMVAKHLCGVATDLALRSLLPLGGQGQQGQKGQQQQQGLTPGHKGQKNHVQIFTAPAKVRKTIAAIMPLVS